MPSKGTGVSLMGVSTHINGRHAFIHERVLELIARETELRGSVAFRKADLAQRLGCCENSVDRAITRLRRDGYVISTPMFSPTGAQMENEYRATAEGVALAARFGRDKEAGYRARGRAQ